MKSIFSKIISGEIPSYKVFEDKYCYSFLDINPNAMGHVLCVPKKQVDKIFDLTELEYNRLMIFSRKVAHAMRKAVPCKRIGMMVIGIEVPHAHVHLIPINTMDDISFKKKVKLTDEEFKQLAKKISSFF